MKKKKLNPRTVIFRSTVSRGINMATRVTAPAKGSGSYRRCNLVAVADL